MKPIKVSKELAGAIAEEQKRQAIDTAKKKAVAQHADYDTFKKMVSTHEHVGMWRRRFRTPLKCHQVMPLLLLVQVSVAHLKPLHAPNSHGSKGTFMNGNRQLLTVS